MTETKVSIDYSEIDSKIIRDDDEWLVKPIVIAAEIVQEYEDGKAYKAADELKEMYEYAKIAGSKPIKVLEHPGVDTDYLLKRNSDTYGRVENFRVETTPRFRIIADGWWNKKVTPKEVIEDIRSNKMRDCSIGFTFTPDNTSGEWNGQHYDYKQTHIFLDHVAAPIPAGRCPGPVCGIGYDSKLHVESDAQCPVCTHMKQVGMSVAGKRLYAAYGPDVLEVIDTGYIPQAAQCDFDKKFKETFGKLKASLT